MVVNVLLWCVFGLLAGAIAQFIMPGKDTAQSGHLKGLALTMVLGIIGAALGGYLSSLFLGWNVAGFNWQSLLVAVGGALIVLLLYRLVSYPTARS